jgi:sarcosine oxidase subunit beta
MHVNGPADAADAVVVGGGTVGGWCAYFLRRAGLSRVILLEKRTLGEGASSRAAGVVRTQGGTPWAVQLGEWSRRFYLSQHDELGIDSGFTPQGYVLPCFTDDDVAAAHERMAMQTRLGLNVRWRRGSWMRSTRRSRPAGRWAGRTARRTVISHRRGM